MSTATILAPSIADIQTELDAAGGWLKSFYAALGTGAPNETTTAAAKAIALRNAGLSILNTSLSQRAYPVHNQIAGASRWESLAQLYSPVIQFIVALYSQNLPYRAVDRSDQWVFKDTVNSNVLDLVLQRANATNALTLAAPTWTPTATAATGGALNATTGGAEPRIKFSYIYSDGSRNYDWIESTPSAASTQVALSGKNNAYSVDITGFGGSVPTGAGKLRAYRQLDNNAGANDPYIWDQDVALTAGTWASQTSGPVLFKINDQTLAVYSTWNPPSFAQFLLLPEEVILFMMALASSAISGGGLGGNSVPTTGTFQSQSNGMLSPVVCTLNSANGFTGYNPTSSFQYGTSSANTYTAGAIQTISDAAKRLQGYIGSAAVRLRVTATLGGTATITNITYTYFDATHVSALQTQSGYTPGTNTIAATLGTTLDLAIPAGRIVQAVTVMTITGAASGTMVCEATPPRSL